MPDVLTRTHGVPVLHCAADGPVVAGDRDAADLVGPAFSLGAELVALPVTRLDPAFFTLGSGVAGQVVQKFATYRVRLAVVGNVAEHLAASAALRDFVAEANRGRQTWFVTDTAELDARLGRG